MRNSISKMITTTGTPSNQRMSGYITRLLSYSVTIDVALNACLPQFHRRHLTELTGIRPEPEICGRDIGCSRDTEQCPCQGWYEDTCCEVYPQ
jgi:hypothetical protein